MKRMLAVLLSWKKKYKDEEKVTVLLALKKCTVFEIKKHTNKDKVAVALVLKKQVHHPREGCYVIGLEKCSDKEKIAGLFALGEMRQK